MSEDKQALWRDSELRRLCNSYFSDGFFFGFIGGFGLCGLLVLGCWLRLRS